MAFGGIGDMSRIFWFGDSVLKTEIHDVSNISQRRKFLWNHPHQQVISVNDGKPRQTAESAVLSDFNAPLIGS